MPPVTVAGRRIGLGICLDSAYGWLGRARVRSGADALVYLSDDTFAGRTVTPELHLRLTAFRAAEVGRPVVFANESGPSAVFGPRGDTLAALDAGEPGWTVAAIPGLSGVTPFVRWGDWLGAIGLGVSLFALFAPALGRGRPGAN
jgi:apolipoprotein N-acyltransferase